MVLMSAHVVKVVKLLGEGGFSFVYLVEDEDSGVRVYHLVNVRET